MDVKAVIAELTQLEEEEKAIDLQLSGFLEELGLQRLIEEGK